MSIPASSLAHLVHLPPTFTTLHHKVQYTHQLEYSAVPSSPFPPSPLPPSPPLPSRLSFLLFPLPLFFPSPLPFSHSRGNVWEFPPPMFRFCVCCDGVRCWCTPAKYFVCRVRWIYVHTILLYSYCTCCEAYNKCTAICGMPIPRTLCTALP